MTQVAANQRRLPVLPRSFVRGFLSGILVMLIAGLGIILAFVVLLPPLVEADWPSTLMTPDCRYSGSIVTAFQIETARSANDVADGYARTWSNSGWDVVTHVAGQYAVLTATRPAMSYTLEIFQQGQVIQAVGDGHKQCSQ